MKLLVNYTDNPSSPSNSGVTPLHIAAKGGSMELVKLFLPLVNNKLSRDERNLDPYDYAVMEKHFEVADFIKSNLK